MFCVRNLVKRFSLKTIVLNLFQSSSYGKMRFALLQIKPSIKSYQLLKFKKYTMFILETLKFVLIFSSKSKFLWLFNLNSWASPVTSTKTHQLTSQRLKTKVKIAYFYGLVSNPANLLKVNWNSLKMAMEGWRWKKCKFC